MSGPRSAGASTRHVPVHHANMFPWFVANRVIDSIVGCNDVLVDPHVVASQQPSMAAGQHIHVHVCTHVCTDFRFMRICTCALTCISIYVVLLCIYSL